MTAEPAVLVAGIGRGERGDDAAGPLVARRIAGLAIPGVEVRVCAGDLLGLVEAWHGRSSVFVVDAVCAGAAPGTILRLDAMRDPLPPGPPSASTHGIGLEEAVAIARLLGKLPESLVVFGIQGASFGFEERVSPEVGRAVDEVCRLVEEEARCAATGRRSRR